MSVADKLSAFEQSIMKHVAESGCHINVVAADDNDPEFAYSVGFPQTVNQPDVIVFGLEGGMMAEMINDTLDQCRSGLVLKDGQRIVNLLDGFDCVVRAVDTEHLVEDYFNSAIWYHNRQTGKRLDKAFQIVWPGYDDGLFPWEENADPDTVASQPALYEKIDS